MVNISSHTFEIIQPLLLGARRFAIVWDVRIRWSLPLWSAPSPVIVSVSMPFSLHKFLGEIVRALGMRMAVPALCT